MKGNALGRLPLSLTPYFQTGLGLQLAAVGLCFIDRAGVLHVHGAPYGLGRVRADRQAVGLQRSEVLTHVPSMGDAAAESALRATVWP